MKAILFLAGERGYIALSKALESGYANQIGFVVSFKEVNVSESFDIKLETLSVENGIKYRQWKDIKDDLVGFVHANGFDCAVAISWRFLLPLELNDYLKVPLIIFHDSLLPRYRGFAPTPTAIINGESVVGVSAIFASTEADNGDIIFQQSMQIDKDDYISDVISRQSEIYADILKKIFEYISSDKELPRITQNEEDATYSIWRDPEDCRVDWNASAIDIHSLIRAVADPYPGAFAYYDDKKIIFEKAEICSDKKFEIRQPGKLWKITDNCPEIICGDGMIRILQARYEDGEPVSFNKLRIRMK